MTDPPSPPLPPPPGDPQGLNAAGDLPIPPGEPHPGSWVAGAPGDLGVGDVIAMGCSLWARHWRLLAFLSLALSGSVLVLQAALDPGPTFRELIEWLREGAPEPIPGASPRAQAVGLLGGLILSPMLTMATLRVLLGGAVGSVPGPGRAVSYGLRRLPSTLWLFLAMGISMVGVGVLAAVVSLILAQAAEVLAVVFVPLVIYPAVRLWSVALPALVVDDSRGFAALGRSWRLTRGRWWATFAVLLLFTLVAAIGSLLTVIVSAVIPWSGTPADLVQASVTAGLGALAGPLGASMLAGLYLDLRVRARNEEAGTVRTLIERHDPP